MRIAVVTSSYPVNDGDPSGHFVRTELRQLIEAGHEVTLLAPRAAQPRTEAGATVHELPHAGLFGWPGALTHMKRSPWRILGLVPFARTARRILHTAAPFDRIIAHWILPGFWPICRDFDTCIHVVAHGSDVRLLERLPDAMQRRVVRGLAQHNVIVRSVSSDLATRIKRLAATYRMALGPIEVEPAAIEIPKLPARDELRRELELPRTPIAIIVGRVVKAKQIDRAIRAIMTALASNSRLAPPTIIVIGDGPELSSLMRRYRQVRWLGRRSRLETLRYIRSADLLVSASTSEGAPTAIREALALGTPVVAARAGDLEIIAESEPLLSVVDPFDYAYVGSTCNLIRQRLESAASATMRPS